MKPSVAKTNVPLKRFKAQCAANTAVFRVKNAEYGNTIEATGVLGAVTELIGAAARLPKLVLRNRTHGRSALKALRNALLDIHNYANIALMMIDSGNWEGRSPWEE